MGDASLLERFVATFHIDSAGAVPLAHLPGSAAASAPLERRRPIVGRSFIGLLVSATASPGRPAVPTRTRVAGFPFGGWQAPLMGQVDGRRDRRGHRASWSSRPGT